MAIRLLEEVNAGELGRNGKIAVVHHQIFGDPVFIEREAYLVSWECLTRIIVGSSIKETDRNRPGWQFCQFRDFFVVACRRLCGPWLLFLSDESDRLERLRS